MQQGVLRSLSDNISYLPASDDPLSADVFFIETDAYVYVYDVGSCAAAREQIEGIKKDKIVVLSHFHADHTENLRKITFRSLYAGRETLKHIGDGNVVEGEILLEASLPIRLMKLPSSHAKDCVVLCYGNEYVFCGDAVYATGKRFPLEYAAGKEVCSRQTEEESGTTEMKYIIKTVYNSQKLKAMIDALKTLDVKYLVLSHKENPLHLREEVIGKLEVVYRNRNKNSAYIIL